MISARAVVLSVTLGLCFAVSAPDLSFAAKKTPGAERVSEKKKGGQAAKTRSLTTIIKKSPREAKPFPLASFSYTGIPEPGPRW